MHLHHGRVGARAVIVGAELVSWSAVLTLREAGCATVAMVSGYPRAEAYGVFRTAGRALLRGPVLTRSRLVAVHGKGRVRSVIVEDMRTGRRHEIDCDTVVFTGDWIPDHELARIAGVRMDAGTRGPAVDAALRTSRPGVFAIGNLLHPVDTADGAALDGRHVATRGAAVAAQWRLARGGTERPHPYRGSRSDGLPRSCFRRTAGRRRAAICCCGPTSTGGCPPLRAVQAGRVLAVKRTPWPAAPGRIFRAPWALVAGADPAGGDVTVSFA